MVAVPFAASTHNKKSPSATLYVTAVGELSERDIKMNTLRKILGFLTAVMLTALVSSGAAFAADKQFTFAVSAAGGTSPTTITATFTNKGNSSFNSVSFTLPAN